MGCGEIPDCHTIEEDPTFIVMRCPSPRLIIFCRLETSCWNFTVEQLTYDRVQGDESRNIGDIDAEWNRQQEWQRDQEGPLGNEQNGMQRDVKDIG